MKKPAEKLGLAEPEPPLRGGSLGFWDLPGIHRPREGTLDWHNSPNMMKFKGSQYENAGPWDEIGPPRGQQFKTSTYQPEPPEMNGTPISGRKSEKLEAERRER